MRSNIYKKIILAILVLMMSVGGVFAGYSFGVNTTFAAINKKINYQGKLTNASNVAVADGNYIVKFRLYTTATSATTTNIWEEIRTATGDMAVVTSGLFSVMLGSSTALTSVDFNQTLYLGVEICGTVGLSGCDGEMSPRKIIGAVPAAFVADTLDNLSSEQFLRSDTQNATSSANTFLNILQTGAGKVAEFFGTASQSVMAILSNGNVGIGTTSPYAKLSVVGEVVGEKFTATSTTATSTFAGGATFATGGGLVGIATTTPATGFAVGTHCVTADTRLRRRRKKKGAKGEGEDEGENDDDYIYDEVMIKDVETGDEIQSLDPRTGKFTWSRVNGLINTGIQPLIRLTTLSGRQIRTTSVHPYLTRKDEYGDKKMHLPQKLMRFEVDMSMKIEDFSADTIVAIANKEQSFTIMVPRKVKQTLRDNLRCLNTPQIFNATVFAVAIVEALKRMKVIIHELIIDTEYTGYEKIVANIIMQTYPGIYISFDKIGKKSPAHYAAHGVHTKKYEAGYKIKLAEILENAESALRATVVPSPRGVGNLVGPRTLLVDNSIFQSNEFVKRGLWTVASALHEGQYIAVAHGNIPAWEKIVKIEAMPAERVYDIEIEGTHNFIGNDIIAHNTYITGGLGVGVVNNTSGTLTVSGLTTLGNASTTNLTITGKLYDSTSSAGTNGMVLQTTGSASTWVATSSLGFLSSSSIGSGTTGQFPYYADAGTTLTSTSSLFLASSGNVGVGTVSPTALLALNATPATNGVGASIAFKRADTSNYGAGIWNASNGTADYLKFGVGSAADPFGDAQVRMTILASGNVGIGTTTPASKLNVYGTTNYAQFRVEGSQAPGINLYTNSADSNARNYLITANSQATGDFIIYDSTTNTGDPSTGVGNARFVIKTGNIGIGTTSPYAKLSVTNTGTDPSFIVEDSTSPDSTPFIVDASGNVSTGGTLTTGGAIYNNGYNYYSGPVLNVQVSGSNMNFGPQSTSYNLQLYSLNTLAATFSGSNVNFLGNVGIGTTTPYAKLSVDGRGVFNQDVRADYFTSTSTTITNTFPLFTSTTGTTTNFAVTSITSSLLKTNSLGQLVSATPGTDYSNFSYLFPSNATSTLLSFSGGLTSYASTTIGNGTQTGGLTISGGATTTGNAYFGGNVGIGTATPGSKLSVSGGATVGASYNTTAAPTNGLIVEGNVGIGSAMSVPTQKLDVAGIIVGRGTATYANPTGDLGDGARFALESVTTNPFAIGIGAVDGTKFPMWFQTGDVNGGGFNWYIGTSEKMRIDKDGNVGIGTTTPDAKLVVQGDIKLGTDGGGGSVEGNAVFTQADFDIKPFDDQAVSVFGINFDSNSATPNMDFYWYGYSGDPHRAFRFIDGNTGTERMRIESYTGNIGIGTTSPYAKLSVTNTGTDPSFIVEDSTSPDSTPFIVDASGNVGVGTVAPGYKLDVETSANNDRGIYILNAGSATQQTGLWSDVIGAAATNVAGYFSATGATNNYGLIVANGNVGIGITAPTQKLDVIGFINTDQYSGYKQAGNTILYASSTNFSLLAGQSAGAALLSDGLYNTAIGYEALKVATSSDFNTAVGYQSLRFNTTGYSNTASGYQSLLSNTTGYQNTANGLASLYSNTTGYQNTANGYTSLYFNTTGYYNTANGMQSLYYNTTGFQNTANGVLSLFSNTTGASNTANGFNSLRFNTSATSSTAIGYSAGQGAANYNNQGGVYVGYQAGYRAGTGSDYNTFLGYNSGYGVTTGARNTLIGNSTIAASYNQVTTGSNNIAIGNDVAVASATASNQLNIGNLIYGTGLSGTGGTVSGGNVGIGTTSPYAKLSVTNTGTDPSFIVEDSTSPDSSPFIIDASGNVGIGTAGPRTTLDVTGRAIIGANMLEYGTLNAERYVSAPYATLTIGDQATPANAVGIYMRANGSDPAGISTAGAPLAFYMGGPATTEVMRILGNGNVGIGTTSPLAKLDVYGHLAITGNNQLKFYNGAGSNWSYIKDSVTGTGSPDMGFYVTSDTADVMITSAGNVGIGTVSPSQKLDVVGFINTDQYSGYKQAGNTILYASSTNYSLLAGQSAGAALLSDGLYNTAIGYEALKTVTSSDSNTAVGYQSLYSNTTGYSNTANGMQSLYSNTTGINNTANGMKSLYSNTTGASNTVNGVVSLYYNTSATSSTAFGYSAGQGTANYNNQGGVYVGYQAGFSASTGSDYNTFLGYNSGYGVTTGARNTLIGNSTIAASYNQVTTGSNNIAIGNDVAVASATASNQLNIGNLIYGTGLSGTGATVSGGNVGIGTTSPYAKLSVAGQTVSEYFTATSTTVASIFPNASTTNLTVSGLFFDSLNSAGLNGYVFQSTGVAAKWVATSTLGITGSGSSLFTDAGSFTYLTATSDDVVFGAATTGNAPFWWDVSATTTYIGNGGAGDSVIQLGDDANAWTLGYDDTDKAFRIASSTTLGSSDVFTILKTGGRVGIGTTTPWKTLSVSGTMALSSSLSVATVGNYLCINQTTYEVTSGTTCSASSRRYKDNIIPISYGLDTVMKLNPVSFTYKPEVDPNGDTRLGFIAEEVQVLLPELVALDKDGLPESVDYSKLVSVLTKAIQELNLKVDAFATSTSSSSLAGGNSFMTNIWNFVSGELSSLGVLVSDGMVKMRALAVDTFTVGSREKPSGITLYDEDTGDPYCLKIKNGSTRTSAGECGTATIATQQNTNTNTTTQNNTTTNTGGNTSTSVTTSTTTTTLPSTTATSTQPVTSTASSTPTTTTDTTPTPSTTPTPTSTPTPEPTTTTVVSDTIPTPDSTVVTTSTETLTITP